MACLALPAADKPAAEPPKPEPAQRSSEVNVLGKTDAIAGESRRNENVQFNLIDNNALKDLNVRLGTTATLFEEFRADQGYFGSEFGNRPVSSIHLKPSKPSSGIHGSLFESHLNSALNARSFFTVGDLKPARENNYGASIAIGPFSLEAGQNKIRGNVNGNVLVPKANERIPFVTDPVKRALIQSLINGFPRELPNRTDINERALNTNSPQTIDDNTVSGRTDQKLNRSNTLNARYSFLEQRVLAFQFVAGQNPDTTTRNHTAVLTWTRDFSPSTIATASAMFDRVTSLLVPSADSPGPTVNFSNAVNTLGPSSYIPIDRAQNRFRYSAGIKQSRGNHNWYANAELARRQINGSEVSSHRGNLYFRSDFGRDSMTNFLMGTPTRISGAVGSIHRGFRLWEPSFSIGDNWRVTSNLQLNYGIRYEITTRPLEVNGLNDIPYGCDCNNVAPRFGFAYRLPREWGLIRAAYGLHYGQIFPVAFSQLRYNPPLNIKFEMQAPDLLAITTITQTRFSPDTRSTHIEISPNLKTPYSHLYNFLWEPLPSRKWRLQLGYVGSRSHKLAMLLYTNRAAPVPGIPLTTATVNDRRPDLRYFDVRRIINGSHAYFDAARVSLVLPRWRGLSLDASYWLSKAIDLGGPYTSTGAGDDGKQSQSQTEKDVWKDVKGPSVFDQKHAFLLRGSYSTPKLPAQGWPRRLLGQWDLSGVLLLKTGTPFSVITGSDGPGFGNVDGDNGDRPNIVDPSILGRTIGRPEISRALLPRSAFAFIQPGEPRGNLGYNTFRKAGIGNVNASLSRTFNAGADRKLTFRAESVNFFNTPQFAQPWLELSSPSFGFITNTLNDGRAFRLHLRFTF